MKITHSDCVGGVVNNNSAEWLHEDTWDATDLNWLEFIANNTPDDVAEAADMWETQGPMLIGFIECDEGDIEAWYEIKSINEGVPTICLKIDPDAEYSAIVHESTTQVVRSKWAQFVRGCTPCYPYQGDLDSPVEFPSLGDIEIMTLTESMTRQRPINNGIVDQGYGWAYTLPPDVWGEWKPEFIAEVKND